jgi:integrase/recombinase XerD
MLTRVTILARIKQDGRYPYVPVSVTSNGRIKPIEGASYHLRFTEGGKRRLVSLGDDASIAMAAALKQEALFNVQAAAKVAGINVPAAQPNADRIKLAAAIKTYLDEIKEHKSNATYRAYSTALNLFTEGCKVVFVDEVGRTCLLNYSAALKKKGYTERTVFNRFSYAYTFLKRYGKTGIVGKTDWPKFEDVEYAIYSEEDVKKMLGACEEPTERLLIMFAAGTGFRAGEISHAELSDVNFEEGTIQTRSKIQYKFVTKDHEQRIITVPDSLIAELKKHKGKKLLFPSRNGSPDRHIERVIQRVCKRAGVVVPKKPTHAFRALFATRLTRVGVDVFSVRDMLGHSDIQTTISYLRSVKRSDPKLKEQVNAASF